MTSLFGLDLQYKLIKKKIASEIRKCTDSQNFILGKNVINFEENITSHFNSKYFVSCASGTEALFLALMASNKVKPGDAIIVPSFTFASTAEIVSWFGCIPIFADVCEKTFNINYLTINETYIKFKKKFNIKAVISVDIFGNPCDYIEISKFCLENNILFISDGAQSLGSKIGNNYTCNLVDYYCTSFFPTKPLGCYGDGGGIFVKSKKIFDKLKSLRAHGKGKQKYQYNYIGMNSRLDAIQASVLNIKIKIFESEIKARNLNRIYYMKNLDSSFIPQSINSTYKSSIALFSLLTSNTSSQKKIINKLRKYNVDSGIYYPVPLHKTKAYKNYPKNILKVTEYLSKKIISIPCHAYLKNNDLKNICSIINS